MSNFTPISGNLEVLGQVSAESLQVIGALTASVISASQIVGVDFGVGDASLDADNTFTGTNTFLHITASSALIKSDVGNFQVQDGLGNTVIKVSGSGGQAAEGGNTSFGDYLFFLGPDPAADNAYGYWFNKSGNTVTQPNSLEFYGKQVSFNTTDADASFNGAYIQIQSSYAGSTTGTALVNISTNLNVNENDYIALERPRALGSAAGRTILFGGYRSGDWVDFADKIKNTTSFNGGDVWIDDDLRAPSIINRSGDVTLSTITSGDIVLRPAGNVEITGSVNVNGAVTATSFTGSSALIKSDVGNFRVQDGLGNTVIKVSGSGGQAAEGDNTGYGDFLFFLGPDPAADNLYGYWFNKSGNIVTPPNSLQFYGKQISFNTTDADASFNGAYIQIKSSFAGSTTGTALVNISTNLNVNENDYIRLMRPRPLGSAAGRTILFGGYRSGDWVDFADKIKNTTTFNGGDVWIDDDLRAPSIINRSGDITLSTITSGNIVLRPAGNNVEITGSVNANGAVTATSFTGSLEGNASTATTADTLTNTNISQFTNDSGYAQTGSANVFTQTNTFSTLNATTITADTITAREYYTEVVSASVIYQSGSTKFGDSSDDTHQFSGSVNISGSIVVVGGTISGNGSSLTSLDANNISAGTLSSDRLPELVVADFAAAAIQTSVESFIDSDDVLMTAAAVDDLIADRVSSFGGGTVTSVTAGSNLDGGTITDSGTISLSTTLTGLDSVTATSFTGSSALIKSDVGNFQVQDGLGNTVFRISGSAGSASPAFQQAFGEDYLFGLGEIDNINTGYGIYLNKKNSTKRIESWGQEVVFHAVNFESTPVYSSLRLYSTGSFRPSYPNGNAIVLTTSDYQASVAIQNTSINKATSNFAGIKLYVYDSTYGYIDINARIKNTTILNNGDVWIDDDLRAPSIINRSGDITLSTITSGNIVLRPAGNIEITGSVNANGAVTATSFTGSLEGNASTATTADTLTNTNISQFTNDSGYAQTGSANVFTQTNTFSTLNATTITADTITAREYYTEVVSASVIYQSGSTKFGDSSDDTHQFSGSVLVSGSLTLTGVDADPSQETGKIWYDSSNNLLSYWTEVTDVNLHIGQQLAIRCKNVSGNTLSKGKVVHITGSTSSDTPLVTTASYESDFSSADTLGVLMQELSPNETGYALLYGVLTGINLQGYGSGDMLYLSSSGDFSNTVPNAPLHEVRIGQVTRNTSNGAMFVRIQNGYEITELHDVLIQNPQAGELLVYNNALGVWENKNTLTGLDSVTATSFTGSLEGNASTATTADALTSMDISQFTNDSGYAQTGSANVFTQTNTFTTIGIGIASPGALLDVSGSTIFGRLAAHTHAFTGSVNINGTLTATAKSFDIEHPTKQGMRLRYGSLEGPENGVYVRGKTKQNMVELPDYWTGLVDEDTITVNLTPIGGKQDIWVEKIENNTLYIGGLLQECYFTVFGERKDVDKLVVEY